MDLLRQELRKHCRSWLLENIKITSNCRTCVVFSAHRLSEGGSDYAIQRYTRKCPTYLWKLKPADIQAWIASAWVQSELHRSNIRITVFKEVAAFRNGSDNKSGKPDQLFFNRFLLNEIANFFSLRKWC
jgi:hypothetical protein